MLKLTETQKFSNSIIKYQKSIFVPSPNTYWQNWFIYSEEILKPKYITFKRASILESVLRFISMNTDVKGTLHI